jgi:hypothetical protein
MSFLVGLAAPFLQDKLALRANSGGVCLSLCWLSFLLSINTSALRANAGVSVCRLAATQVATFFCAANDYGWLA